MLALFGTAIAGYLASYQLGIVDSVWEPFFGDGSSGLAWYRALLSPGHRRSRGYSQYRGRNGMPNPRSCPFAVSQCEPNGADRLLGRGFVCQARANSALLTPVGLRLAGLEGGRARRHRRTPSARICADSWAISCTERWLPSWSRQRVSGHTVPGGHRLEPEPVLLDAGESRILAVLELRVCNDEQEVALDEIEPLTVMGDGATLDGFWLLPGGTDLDDTGLATLPSGSVAVPPGDRITVDEPRLLAARLLGTGEGNFILGLRAAPLPRRGGQ